MRKIKTAQHKPRWDTALKSDFSDNELKQLADEMLEWIMCPGEENKNANFWLNDFAAEKMLIPSQLNSFAMKNEYFGKVYRICRMIQESKLLKMALYKEVNATPAVFILKAVIGTGESDKPADLESAKSQIEEIFEQ
jgi:hypothetical protein